jgi:hypothetical protein
MDLIDSQKLAVFISTYIPYLTVNQIEDLIDFLRGFFN